ncbi:hypothetical protein HAX54_003736, partial [Datura stramonium]|nr:hypothetical protein [Datura stramonium]
SRPHHYQSPATSPLRRPPVAVGTPISPTPHRPSLYSSLVGRIFLSSLRDCDSACPLQPPPSSLQVTRSRVVTCHSTSSLVFTLPVIVNSPSASSKFLPVLSPNPVTDTHSRLSDLTSQSPASNLKSST